MSQWTDSELEDAYVRGYQDGCEQAKAEFQRRLAVTDKSIDELRTRLQAAEAESARRKRASITLLAKRRGSQVRSPTGHRRRRRCRTRPRRAAELERHFDMARLNEAQLAFLFGFCCGSEWSWLEFRQRMEQEVRRDLDEMKRENKEWRRQTDERLDKELRREAEEMRAVFEEMCAVFAAAIEQTVPDPDTALKIWKAVQAELARVQAADSATEPHHRPSDS